MVQGLPIAIKQSFLGLLTTQDKSMVGWPVAAKEKSKEVVEDSGEVEEEQEEDTSGSGKERVVTLLAGQCNVAATIARSLAEEIEVEAEGPVASPSGACISKNPTPKQVPKGSIVEASAGEILVLWQEVL
ncbi:hypothetical protein C0989_001686 [Termitomyces sp. Mn162]|nr:hypothetical protein C0989_001686 [Termitomyces sp. Mn162]